ncbi:YhgE/Pip domain-containing protein [Tessaracoccus terricola]
MRPESTVTGRKVGLPALIALVLVPLLAVGGLLALVNGNGEERVQAAVVNLDEAVTVGDQYIPMGRQLAAAIMDREGSNISWTLADQANAQAGLASGQYSAVVTIPKEFSAAATSFSENDAAVARQATIDITMSENAPVTDARLAKEIAGLAREGINSTLTESYLDNVFIGFNSVGDQFGAIVDGASQLSDGATQLADGTDELSDGTGELADGMGQLSDGALQLNDGGAQLASGSTELVDGGAQVVAGGDALTEGSGQLVSGGNELAAGADELSQGVEQFAGELPALVDGVGQLVDGAEQLLPGIPDYTDGTRQVVGGVGELKAGIDQMIAGLDAGGQTPDPAELEALGTGATEIGAGVQGIAGGLEQVDGALQGFATGAVPAPAEVQAIGGQIAAAFECPVADPATCAMLEQTFAAGAAAGVTAGFQAGAGTASAALSTPDASGASLIDGASQLATESAPFFDGVGQLAQQLPALLEGLPALRDGLQQLSDGAGELVTGAQPLVDNADALGSGATQLLGGMQQLDQQLQAMPGGVAEFTDGVSQFADGVGQYTSGVETYTSGVGQFAEGVETYADGVGTYADGVGDYIDGVGTFADGVVTAADGTQDLADGVVQLDDGAQQLADGVDTFATELSAGADQVPTYSEEERAALSTVVASPVDGSDELASNNSVGLAALLLVAGLWLIALAAFVVARAVPSDVVSSRAPSIALWARAVGLPAILAAGLGVVFGVVGSVVVGLGLGRSLGLVFLLAALGVSFVLVNHALVAWLGNVGRGISALLLVATVALGITSGLPAWFDSVATFSPAQNGLLMVRTWMADGSGMTGLVGAAVLVAAIAFALSYLAIASRRQLTADQFRRRVVTA